jgi:hypothetical protein
LLLLNPPPAEGQGNSRRNYYKTYRLYAGGNVLQLVPLRQTVTQGMTRCTRPKLDEIWNYSRRMSRRCLVSANPQLWPPLANLTAAIPHSQSVIRHPLTGPAFACHPRHLCDHVHDSVPRACPRPGGRGSREASAVLLENGSFSVRPHSGPSQ